MISEIEFCFTIPVGLVRIQSAAPQQTVTFYIQNVTKQLQYIIRPTSGQNSNQVYQTLGGVTRGVGVEW